MPKPTPVNAECYITARLSMEHVYDFERKRAQLKERYPNWEEEGAMYAWHLLGDDFFKGALPRDWFEIAMMFILEREGKLK